MVKDDILEVIDSKVRNEMNKVQYHCFKVIKDERVYSDYINFPNGDYLFDRYMEYIGTLEDSVFMAQLKRRYIEFEDGIDEKDLMKYIGHNLRVFITDTHTLSISYDDTETFEEIALRIYYEVLDYAKDCYRKEYLAEHTEVKWKIFINYGFLNEIEMINNLTFKTKKDACDYANEHGYPLHCVVREETWKEWKAGKCKKVTMTKYAKY